VSGFLAGVHRQELLPYVRRAGDKGEIETLATGIPVNEVPGASLYSVGDPNHPALLLLRNEGRLAIIPAATNSCLAQTGDAVLTHNYFESHIALYSADTAQETASMNVPSLADDDAKCIALWHDRMAVFLLPKAFVFVDFTKHTFKVIHCTFTLNPKVRWRPLWVEGSASSSKMGLHPIAAAKK
jgi:hypothetical protein